MTDDPGRPSRILAVMDGDDTEIALRSALALADRHGAALEVLACVEPPHDLAIVARHSGRPPEDLIAALAERRRAEMRARLSALAPDPRPEPQVAVGKAYLEIVRHVARRGCDFAIKKAEPLSGINRFLFASTDQHLLRKCPCPVWLQTAAAPAAPRRVLAAVDLDLSDAAEPATLAALNRRVIEVARGVADGPEAEVVVLHAWEAIGEGMVWAFSGGSDARISADRYVNEILESRRQAMDRLLGPLRRDGAAGPRLVPRLARGAPERVIGEQCRELGADLAVLGTVARTGLSGVFIGNTAENIINSLDRPVLAVKPEGFVSPLLDAG
jgi:nucleotide-binding universal stress UspA family protein